MDAQLFQGQFIRLTPFDAEKDAETESRWTHDAEFSRLISLDIARPLSANQIKKKPDEDKERNKFRFAIRTRGDDKPIGFIGLNRIRWNLGDAYVAIGLGERELWGKGYGTDAMRIILRYAFTELNLHRVSLTVFEYNPRGVRSYEKCGFRVEGRERAVLHRDGKRYDVIAMGILKSEWRVMCVIASPRLLRAKQSPSFNEIASPPSAARNDVCE